MRMTRAICVGVLLSGAGGAVAQSVVNLQTTKPAATQQPAQPSPSVQASIVPSLAMGQLPPSLSDSALAKLEPQPGESNDAFLARMKAVSQKAVAEMERTLKEHIAKMQALAPK